MRLATSTARFRLPGAVVVVILLFCWPAGPTAARAVKRQSRVRLATPSMIYLTPYGAAYAYPRVPRGAGATRYPGRRNRSGVYGTNRKAGSAGVRSGNARAGAARRVKAGVDLPTEIQALRVRHAAFVAKLPADMRQLDREALPTFDRLPHLAQLSYLTTIEDYGTLSAGEQTRLHTMLQGIVGLSEEQRTRFIEYGTKSFNAIQSDETQLRAARAKPHDTLFRLQSDLDHAPMSSASG